ncbi:hypothetical protein GALMADRAFT_247763 [Galerina marginata CBS 339.88]|uniref:Methyltransferase domain-containing protein n=1 Tax=Galerina marginata (strain CBS 339.88) TaxID=685588 RepID=A0A067SZP3_GALM3|nr:hypothetical protein GALMADRAFT_247763 [Galerina marginata CBS 339.88]
MSVYADPALKPKLDPSFYSLRPDERIFFQKLTGIQDEEALKEHIIAVQAKAYAIYGYPCIRRFSFIKLKIARQPAYKYALKLLQDHKDPILLDIGCCFGNDTRKAVVDGWPVQNVIASDLQQGFWDYGHELFKSTPESFPAAFIAGDVFDPAMLTISPTSDLDTSTPLPSLNTLTSLTPLARRVSAIHASAFFHLFSETRQLELALRLAALLLPEKGSLIFGQHISRPERGLLGGRMFCHSPDSWRELWTKGIFGPNLGVTVEVDAALIEVDTGRETTESWLDKFHLMRWAVRVI